MINIKNMFFHYPLTLPLRPRLLHLLLQQEDQQELPELGASTSGWEAGWPRRWNSRHLSSESIQAVPIPISNSVGKLQCTCISWLPLCVEELAKWFWERAERREFILKSDWQLDVWSKEMLTLQHPIVTLIAERALYHSYRWTKDDETCNYVKNLPGDFLIGSPLSEPRTL